LDSIVLDDDVEPALDPLQNADRDLRDCVSLRSVTMLVDSGTVFTPSAERLTTPTPIRPHRVDLHPEPARTMDFFRQILVDSPAEK
jgi:hypothetical protein